MIYRKLLPVAITETGTPTLETKADVLRAAAALPLHVLLVFCIGAFAYVSYLEQRTQKETTRELIVQIVSYQDKLQTAMSTTAEKAADNLRYLVDAHSKQLDVIIAACDGPGPAATIKR